MLHTFRVVEKKVRKSGRLLSTIRESREAEDAKEAGLGPNGNPLFCPFDHIDCSTAGFRHADQQLGPQTRATFLVQPDERPPMALFAVSMSPSRPTRSCVSRLTRAVAPSMPL